ncbi:Undecaprenyl-phosphate galactose phosphotransferase WbaP/exopolysaccharide biosynthesis polyprenyl glycosylphosphotransferase [Lentzea atacamensis]|uniref:Undecaprenyl-phosphate galactose phosphotransferase WbaP/exopolysaccharide biosynthesis polyprenyl glycosylphosphotransferase n=1 Tax=Lentzea atacamensis TaxID=531938 RepID=A0A316IR23_9PSEU|nr:sugar transferase [Lentzea atacamensis]PWK89585.1 Undecaprenyl-phosphate galactose phosphotransferase WbaP/exopolysaccharide biosynthesis polyprenyl glycosylphosphotransferase [Lentzea atacamensis]RAS60635.1 Undecaprenyl-phosphate galactose phosphotransferase WbaP/exopolysaccharide biosynthesis polyprenyl glycosylphosphotransferase [Lentzea atacamensis]
MIDFDQPWWLRYRRFLTWSDAAVVLWSVSSVPIVAKAVGGPMALVHPRVQILVTIGAAAAWWMALSLFASRDQHVLGVGQEEYKRVAAATINVAGSVTVLAYLSRNELVRAYLVQAIPIGMAALLLTRWLWRQWLYILRRDGEWSSRTFVVGAPAQVTELTEQLRALPAVGYAVVGTYVVPDECDETDLARSILRMARRQFASVIAVAACGAIGPSVLRRLGWLLEGTDMQLVIMPGLTAIAGPRVHTRPVAGLPLLCIEEPSLIGARRVAKRAFDFTVALVGVVVLVPVFLTIAVLITLDSKGPVFHRQWRIGKHGKEFRIWKFRTMVPDAEARRDELAAHNDSDGPLFKIQADPRVTRVGRRLRLYSLDELPQLLNVITGRMSLVGPRPPLPDEVLSYAKDTRRRLLVKPGLTGLWQISGRSDLNWHDGLALDLYYVENWSFTTDLVILWKTIWVVVRGVGAY